MLGWQGNTRGEGPWNRKFIALCEVEIGWGIGMLGILVLAAYSSDLRDVQRHLLLHLRLTISENYRWQPSQIRTTRDSDLWK